MSYAFYLLRSGALLISKNEMVYFCLLPGAMYYKTAMRALIVKCIYSKSVLLSSSHKAPIYLIFMGDLFTTLN
jgi:hypothetical protein